MTIRSAAKIDDNTVKSLLSVCSAKLAELLSQPEAYVMTLFDRVVDMTMAGTDKPSCLVAIRSVVKLTCEQTRAMTAAFCPLLEEYLGVPPNRVFLNFTDFSGAMWGCNNATLEHFAPASA
ncbi:MAG: phenylpyruvate tautomerase MIF-related protein [Myxococcales bacterium]